MNAGKSTALLQVAHNYEEQGRRIKEGEQISIGGNESYRQACGRCFYA